MDLRAMKQERGVLHEKATALLNAARLSSRNLTKDEQAEFDRLIAQESELVATIEREERAASLGDELSRSQGRKTSWDGAVDAARQRASADLDLAVRAWALASRGRPTKEMLAAADRLGVDPANKELELRVLSKGTTDAGGYATNTYEAIRAFDQAEKFFGPVRDLARVFTTETGSGLPVPTIDDTANTAEIVTESSGITTTADPVFGEVLLRPFQYASKALIVTRQLIEDAAIPLANVLFEKLGERIGRKQNTDFTTGAGTTLPFGIQVQASLGKTASATNAITWDEVFDTQAAVDPAYAARPTAGFMMHSTIANYLRKLKDSQNRYLWTMDLQGPSPAQGNARGVAGRIAGYPVYINNDMDSALSTNKRLVLFGDFARYWIQDVQGPRLVRADELRLLTNEVVFVAFRRTDGNLVNTAAVKYLRTA